jgi:hypothetical protein
MLVSARELLWYMLCRGEEKTDCKSSSVNAKDPWDKLLPSYLINWWECQCPMCPTLKNGDNVYKLHRSCSLMRLCEHLSKMHGEPGTT